jgi:nitroreductase
MIEEIIQAGLLAPYARAAVSREDFRKFMVIPRESEVTGRVASLIKRRATALFENFSREMHQDEYIKNHGGPWLERLKKWSEQGPPNIGIAPYYIVVAEQRGIPAMEEESLGHCLENMWLKATALGLGFQILSITEQMVEDREFCELIGISGDEFSLNGCVIGYAEENPPPTKRPSLQEATSWL